MNMIGVGLSLLCLIVALVEIRIHSELPGRRLGAMIFATAAWITMGAVALDQSVRYKMLQKDYQTSTDESQTRFMTGRGNSWQYVSPDGAMAQFYSPNEYQMPPQVKHETHLVGEKNGL